MVRWCHSSTLVPVPILNEGHTHSHICCAINKNVCVCVVRATAISRTCIGAIMCSTRKLHLFIGPLSVYVGCGTAAKTMIWDCAFAVRLSIGVYLAFKIQMLCAKMRVNENYLVHALTELESKVLKKRIFLSYGITSFFFFLIIKPIFSALYTIYIHRQSLLKTMREAKKSFCHSEYW